MQHPEPPPPQQVVVASPPPPLSGADAHSGLTITDIAARNGHTTVGIHKAIKRFGMTGLKFKNFRLFSTAQADYLKQHMKRAPIRDIPKTLEELHERQQDDLIEPRDRTEKQKVMP